MLSQPARKSVNRKLRAMWIDWWEPCLVSVSLAIVLTKKVVTNAEAFIEQALSRFKLGRTRY